MHLFHSILLLGQPQTHTTLQENASVLDARSVYKTESQVVIEEEDFFLNFVHEAGVSLPLQQVENNPAASATMLVPSAGICHPLFNVLALKCTKRDPMYQMAKELFCFEHNDNSIWRDFDCERVVPLHDESINSGKVIGGRRR